MNRREFFKKAAAVVGIGVLGATVVASEPKPVTRIYAFGGRDDIPLRLGEARHPYLGADHTHSISISDHTHSFVLHDQTVTLRDVLASAQPDTRICLAPGQFTENVCFEDNNAL